MNFVQVRKNASFSCLVLVYRKAEFHLNISGQDCATFYFCLASFFRQQEMLEEQHVRSFKILNLSRLPAARGPLRTNGSEAMADTVVKLLSFTTVIVEARSLPHSHI